MYLSRKKKANSLVLIFIVFIFSCRKTEDLPTFSNSSKDAITNFDAFWHGINDNYIFFAYDNVNWDDAYSEFRPKVTSGMSELELLRITYAMFSKLVDGHRLIKTQNASYGALTSDYYEKHPRVESDSLIIGKYIDTSLVATFTYEEKGTANVEFYLSPLLKTNIIYIRYFGFHTALENAGQNDAFNEYLKQIQENAWSGIILDLRGNGGGLATSFKNLISKFVPANYTWGYSKFRVGRDRYETTPFIAETASFAGTKAFTKPLLILTDRYSFSAAELTALALHNLPNITIIGDTTGGAQGPIISVENSQNALSKDFTGNFKLPNGWLIQLALKATFDNQKQIFEGKGLPPSIVVKPSQAALNLGRDNVLDKAIDYLKNK